MQGSEKPLRPQTHEFLAKNGKNGTIVLQRQKKKGLFTCENIDVFGKDVQTEMHLIFFFFSPLSPFLPFFSGSHLKCHINKRCPGWCSRASPCPAGAVSRIKPGRTKSTLPPQIQQHVTHPAPAAGVAASLPRGCAGSLCTDAAPCGWGTRSPSAQTLRPPVANLPLWPVSLRTCESRALRVAGN